MKTEKYTETLSVNIGGKLSSSLNISNNINK